MEGLKQTFKRCKEQKRVRMQNCPAVVPACLHPDSRTSNRLPWNETSRSLTTANTNRLPLSPMSRLGSPRPSTRPMSSWLWRRAEQVRTDHLLSVLLVTALLIPVTSATDVIEL